MISAMPEDYSLSEEQKQHFLEHGFIKLENCFSLEDEQCKKLMDRVWERLDMNPNDKETWNPWRGMQLSPRRWKYLFTDKANHSPPSSLSQRHSHA